jgi:16S rRNA (guanine527-N7)-methyltransferase
MTSSPPRAASLLETDIAVALDDGLGALGLGLSKAQKTQMLSYVELLEKWNRTFNLTAIRDKRQMVAVHLLDSLAILPHIAPTARLADVGSGAGLPGIPLAIALPGAQVTMIDSVAKKTAFVQQAIGELALKNAQAHGGRAEHLKPGTPYDIVVSRAFAELRDFAECSRHLLSKNGRLLAMKGLYPHDEIARLPQDIAVVETLRLNVPGIAAERHLIILEPKHPGPTP